MSVPGPAQMPIRSSSRQSARKKGERLGFKPSNPESLIEYASTANVPFRRGSGMLGSFALNLACMHFENRRSSRDSGLMFKRAKRAGCGPAMYPNADMAG